MSSWSAFFLLNTILFLFNLIPLPPLDGSSVIMLFMSGKTARRYLDMIHGGFLGVFGILIAWIAFRHIFYSLIIPILNILFIGI